MAKIMFPDSFCWGATSSAFQIEGDPEGDGRSPSIWDKFCATSGLIKDGSDARRTAEHRKLWEADLDLMKRINLQSYGFSVSWSRVLPNGSGPINDRGLDFYDRLVDGMLQRGIAAQLTLNHWDLPLILEDKGGWLRRDLIYNFADYAQKVAARLGDRVSNWITHNDPYAIAFEGYKTGTLAPGEARDRNGWVAAHHLLLAHAEASEALKAEARLPGSKIGIALRLSAAYPASDSHHDHIEAVQWDGEHSRWFLGPLFKGDYPDDIFQKAKAESGERALDWLQRGDLARIRNSADFLGVNVYTRTLVRSGALMNAAVSERKNPKNATDMGYEVAPDSVRELLVRLHQDYAPDEIIVTENGASYSDAVNEFGRYADQRRTAYLSSHLQAIGEALSAGAPVTGYYVRSFLDSWEWTEGFTQKYGLVHVDFRNGQRTLRDSAYWYARVIDTKNHDWNPAIDYREG